jgi:hypothetical protein
MMQEITTQKGILQWWIHAAGNHNSEGDTAVVDTCQWNNCIESQFRRGHCSGGYSCKELQLRRGYCRGGYMPVE